MMLIERTDMLKDHVTFTSSQQIAQIAKPLMDSCELNYFGYCRLYPDNKFFNLATRPEWAEYHFIDHNLPPAGLLNYDKIESGVVLPAMSDDALFGWPEGLIKSVRERFNVTDPLIIFKKHATHTDIFLYSLQLRNPYQFYFQHMDIFEKFTHYFHEQGEKIITKSAKAPILYKNNHLITFDGDTVINQQLEELKQAISPKRYKLNYNGNIIKVPDRRYQVLQLLAHGNVPKIIATKLNLSTRTVRFYIDTLKTDFNILSSHDLIEIYWNNTSSSHLIL